MVILKWQGWGDVPWGPARWFSEEVVLLSSGRTRFTISWSSRNRSLFQDSRQRARSNLKTSVV